MASLTHLQQDILSFLRTYHAEYDHLPSSRVIQGHYHWASQTAAMTHLRALCRKGHLQAIRPPHSRTLYRFPRP